jgi:exonuclease SbcC
MKIKKVEIQAFKSYLYREDGTFDFTQLGDASQPANFISIYAPNGFGKTSFYDAIDYCMTNNISRYIRAKVQGMNQKEAKTHNQQGEKQYILRNRAADSVEKERKIMLNTQVSVFTTSDIEPVLSQYKPPISGSMDYKFDPKAARIGSGYFERVLVSQEAIDTFLREDNPVERYNKFIDKSNNSGLARANSNRSIINTMLKDIDLAANKETEKRDEAQADIDKLVIPEGLFTDVNKVVSTLNETGVVFNALTSEFTKEDKLRLDNQAALERAAKQQVLKIHRNNCEVINLFLPNIENLQHDYSDKKQLEAQIELLFATINQKQTLAAQYSKLNSNQKNASDLRQYIEQLNSFIAQVPMLMVHKAELVAATKKSNLLTKELVRLKVSTRNESEALVTDRTALQSKRSF